MPNYTNSEASVQRLAEIIAGLVIDIDDVVLTATSKKSLIIPICSELRTKSSCKLILQIQRAWATNKYSIRDRVREQLNQRFNRDDQASLQDLPHNSIASEEAFPNQKQDFDDGMENYFDRSDIEETVGSLPSPPKSEEILSWETPKSRKRYSDTNLQNQSLPDKMIDNESSIDSFPSVVHSSSLSNKSVSGYVEPPQSPSIRKKFCTSLGRIKIPSVQLTGNDGDVDKDKVRATISNCMLHDFHYSCPLSFYGGIRPNLEFLVTYAKCRYASHSQSFRFDVTDFKTPFSTIYFKATECGEIVHEGPKIHCTLKGEDRIKVKAQLMKVAPRILQLETTKKIDPEMADDGHMQELMRLSTYQKAKSEENCKNDKILRSNDLSDLFQQHIIDGQSSDPYIRHAGLPLYAHMYSEEQLDFISPDDIVVHFDATGNVVRKPADVRCKRIMYYAMVMNKNNSIIPIAEMVSSEHDVASIGTFLKRYRYFLATKNFRWPLFRVVVVDWSWALINSVMIEWNMMTVTDYLKQAFIYLQQETHPSFDFIVIHSCCAHFQKRVSTNIHKKFTKYLHLKNFILECVGLMIHCRTMDTLDDVFEKFMTVLMTPNREQAQRTVVQLHELHCFTKNSDIANETVADEHQVELVSDDKPEGSIYADSPFYHRYYARLLSIKSNVIESVINNEYLAPEIADYVTQSLMPYVPMWSALLLKHVVPNHARLSNANVECYFNLVKRDVLEGNVNLKIGRFIAKMKNYKSSLCTEAALSIPVKGRRSRAKTAKKRSCDQTRRTENSDTPNNALVQEMWQRKRRAQYSHLEGRLLGKITKKIKATDFRTSTPNRVAHEQSLLNRSDSSTHANALPNGLFMDVEYYMLRVEGIEFTIGRYRSSSCAPVIGYDNFDLVSDQYQSLDKKRYLDGAVIDAYSVATLDFRKNVVYVPTGYTYFLLGDGRDKVSPDEFRMYHVGDALQGTMFMPYVYLQHWCLLVVNIDAKTIMHLDPKFKRSNKSASVLKYFGKYVEECARIQPNVLCNIEWTTVHYKGDRPLQKDGYNCGIYVLYYIECLAKGVAMDTNFQPDTYRLEVAESLLKLSRDMKDICQYCFGTRPNELIMCNTCRRWAHLKCVNLLGNPKTLEEWNDPAVSYRCALCAHGVRKWMRY